MNIFFVSVPLCIFFGCLLQAMYEASKNPRPYHHRPYNWELEDEDLWD
jgi:hypothetical protein